MWRILTENNVLFCDEEFKTKKEAIASFYFTPVVPKPHLDVLSHIVSTTSNSAVVVFTKTH